MIQIADKPTPAGILRRTGRVSRRPSGDYLPWGLRPCHSKSGEAHHQLEHLDLMGGQGCWREPELCYRAPRAGDHRVNKDTGIGSGDRPETLGCKKL
ncbi:hypothetical protein RRG08_059459 [Elysia crispata]|uniref:Uncharacterized protein n=1 Tax=Elysia crispata TaxID=231223 RepID=A0AAE1A438_9GAST|nr:hypothetical protein RRG08_059459 [Elysia crispata]